MAGAMPPVSDGAVSSFAWRRSLRAALRTVKSTPNRWLARVFPDAPPEVLIELSGRLRRRSVGPSEVIVAEGDPTDAFYIVTAGEAEVTQHTGHEEVYLRTLVTGDFFGEIGLLQATTRTATVRAVRRVRSLAAANLRAILGAYSILTPPERLAERCWQPTRR